MSQRSWLLANNSNRRTPRLSFWLLCLSQECFCAGAAPPGVWTRPTTKWSTSSNTTKSSRTKWTACAGSWRSWRPRIRCCRVRRGRKDAGAEREVDDGKLQEEVKEPRRAAAAAAGLRNVFWFFMSFPQEPRETSDFQNSGNSGNCNITSFIIYQF